MSNVADPREAYRREFAARAASRPGRGLPWLERLRTRALERFLDHGFPTLRNEDWKYTDVRLIARHRFAAPVPPPRLERALLAPHTLDAYELVFVDGAWAPELSNLGTLPSGVRISSLAARLEQQSGELEGRLGLALPAEQNGFFALNTAFAADGALIEIGRDAAPDRPIHLLFVSTAVNDSVRYYRNFIDAAAGSRAAIVESHVALNPGGYLTNAVTEVMLEPGATLEHYRLGRDGDAAWHIGGTYVRQQRDSRYDSHVVALGGRLARHELRVALNAQGAECRLNGLTCARDRQHVDHHTHIDHRRPHTTSREWYKAVLDDQARAVFSGRVVVHPDAQHADAEQNNRNLLLSPDAEADARPQLEIYADDVKCAHGSATGHLDRDQLFYLRTRGLDAGEAQSLLVYAFAADVLARMGIEPLRRRLRRELAGALLPGRRTEEVVS
jgi:Fe-S cluster assembly protein SufD